MRKVHLYIALSALLFSLLLNVYLAQRGCERITAEVVRIDTIVVRDTVRVTEPKLVTEMIVRYDTVYVPEKAILGTQDSLNVPESAEVGTQVMLPITQRVYEDSTYKAVVRGYNPELVSFEMYRKEVYYPMIVEKKVKPKVVVSAGVYGGFGVKGADYGVGVSVGVPIWSW